MQLRSRTIATVTAFLIAFAGPALAGGCLKDTRQIKVGGANAVRLSDYLCRSDQDPQTRLRVQFQRLSGLAPGVVLNGGSAPWLGALYGKFQVADNDVLKEYRTLITRFGSAVRSVDVGEGEGNHLWLSLGRSEQRAKNELESAGTRKGAVVRSFDLVPLPEIPLVDEALHILNEQTWPAAVSMHYASHGYSSPDIKTPLDNMTVWRYLTPTDLKEYEGRLRRYNALIGAGPRQRKFLPKSVQLLEYLTAGGWPEGFLHASARVVRDEGCLALDFVASRFSFEVDVAIIENVSPKAITLSQLLGQSAAGRQLRRATRDPDHAGVSPLQLETVTLEPSARLIVPLRLVLAGEHDLKAADRAESDANYRKITASAPGTMFRTEVVAELRGNTAARKGKFVVRKLRESFKPPSYPAEADYAFGPEWTLAGVALGSEQILFATAPPNFIQITAGSETGSCPILYAFDGATWLRHGKVIYKAQSRARIDSETISFNGLIRRFRLAEEELERATITKVHLRLDLVDGRTLVLLPEGPSATSDEPLAVLYANDEAEIDFALPVGLQPEQVARSSLTLTGYYDRYAALLVSAMPPDEMSKQGAGAD